ncbi:hypothetical protein SAMN05892883_0980 [Jatrophihabitans sp. GAS493]|uniref:peptidyl-tRNA hydrolase n=1 Tax=Jatrophihabitans sp. GAS493 TaxID=1907575 RepID=UPI000BB71276|nr:peptidyl-tRNA hydrolase [Jatrophihabitans sp. GAS493]SOD71461.1 hypothetical protein SAMN05892883_0980 [Jatrophihabitans sp. GAS493]
MSVPANAAEPAAEPAAESAAAAAPEHRSTPGHRDPKGEAPWAMQLVVRIEKADPPSRTAALEAAALATVMLLTDDRAQADGVWEPAIHRWLDGHIRKHVRRARGAQWEQSQQLPGVTVTHRGAEARAFVPMSTAGLPPELRKLQLSGTELEDPDRVDDHSAAEPQPDGALVIAITPLPPLPLGKAAAAAGHAAQLAAMSMPEERFQLWAGAGFPLLVTHPTPADWLKFSSQAPVTVVDAGFTVVEPNTMTAAATWR